MGVFVEEAVYELPTEICYSLPVTCDAGEWSVVTGLSIDDFSRAKMTAVSCCATSPTHSSHDLAHSSGSPGA